MNLSNIKIIESYHIVSLQVDLQSYATGSLVFTGIMANGKLRKGSVRIDKSGEKLFFSLDEKLQHKIIMAATERISNYNEVPVQKTVFYKPETDSAFEKLSKILRTKHF